ncbi:MAG: hypothetical protein HY277_09405, partial [Ignavibacteriales bacterium]|nr:hypothetical protein [Ignavibacteriales bacterium]
MLHAVMFRRVLLCGFLLLMLCGISLGQWSRDPKTNTPIATLRSHQTNPKIVSDGAGGAIITWQDSRDSATTSRGTDIYVQRINARGSNQWTNNGAIICRFDSNQITPAIVNDGGGGAIIVWQDNRNGNADIYAQHVAADSTKQWTANGIPVCTEAHEQTAPAIIRDNVGGVIIVWQDYRNGNADIYAQRIDAGGTPTWTSDGVIVCSATNDQVNPAIVKDNAGGAVIVWQDLRNNSDYDIYAQRVSSGGASLWSSNGVVISDKVNHQRYPQLIDDGSNGAIIVWEDFGNGDADIFAQHVASDGSRQWTSTGVIIAQQANDQTLPKIATDGVGGAIVSWQDARSGNADVYTQRVNASGTILWGTGGIALCSESHDQVKPNMVSDGNFGAIVTWEDSRSGNADVYAQRVTSSGSTLWASNGIAACTDTLTQSGPEIVNDGVQGAIITWQAARKLGTQGWDVYAQHVNPDGSLGGYAIHGTIYNDLNRNGVQETGETGLSGWTINISGPMSKSATSDANGIYSLDGLIPGIYVVKEVIKSGWMQTSATDSTVNLPIGGDSIRNFGNFQLATIAGVVYKDRNHNGGKDPGEPGLQNWSIKLSGPSSASALTDANGNFIFIGLFTGTFVVKADPKSGWLQTNHPDSLVVNIDTMGQDVAGLAFGQFELGKVNGKIYKDVTGDSVISPAGDSTVAGWSVSILKPGF